MQGFYEQFNEKLARTLQGNEKSASENIVEEPAVKTAKLTDGVIYENGGNLEGQGSLRIQVSSASGAVPIPGAKVTVMETEEQGGAVIASLVTDRSGRTERVQIATPLAKFSQQPGNIQPYRNVNVMVEVPGYYVKENINVPIFDKIESIQPVALEPLPEGVETADPQIVMEYEKLGE